MLDVHNNLGDLAQIRRLLNCIAYIDTNLLYQQIIKRLCQYEINVLMVLRHATGETVILLDQTADVHAAQRVCL